MALLYFGYKLKCPICGRHFRKFMPYGRISRPNAQCPSCLSLERHRLIWLYLTNKTDLLKHRMRILHFAPEKCISDRLRKLNNIEYTTADISSLSVDVIMDITKIPCKSNSYHIILCSHVLEHVLDDKSAMKELYRILRPDGLVILQVPIGRKTFEDASITNWEDRERIFCQGDHVRIYGLDFAERLRSVGFFVMVKYSYKEYDKNTIEKYRLSTENIYLCRK